jgi:CRP-like cAMP-binding protein
MNSALLIKFTQGFMKEFESTVNKLVDISTKQVRRRVAETLMQLMQAHGLEEDNLTLMITLSRDDLAHLIATNTETLVRVLSEFKKEKIIALKGKRIQILNPALLARVISIS